MRTLKLALLSLAAVSPSIWLTVTAPPTETFLEAVTAPLSPLISAESVARILSSFKEASFVFTVLEPTAEVALFSISLRTNVPPKANLSAASIDTETPQIFDVFSEFTESFDVFVATPVTEPPYISEFAVFSIEL